MATTGARWILTGEERPPHSHGCAIPELRYSRVAGAPQLMLAVELYGDGVPPLTAKGLMTPASTVLRAGGSMSGDGRLFRSFGILGRALSNLLSAIACRIRERTRDSVTVWSDPFLPVILLGVIVAAFVFAFILNAPAEIVFGVLGIGCLTAFLETKQRN
jgi:hypothetical protein